MRKVGQLVRVEKTSSLRSDMSFYYVFNSIKDSILIGDSAKFQLNFINREDWAMEVQIGKLDETLSFVENPQIFKSNNKSMSIQIKPNNIGVNLLLGKLKVTSLNDKDSSLIVREFLLYNEYCVKSSSK